MYQEAPPGVPPVARAHPGEVLPRIAMLEEAVRGRRVLEVDAVELAGLLRLSDAGAVRVAATTARPERFSVASLRGRRIELIAMETGRVDFEDGSFDVAIVSDLARARTANPRFLDDLRRVLDGGGAALFALPAAQPGIEQLSHELRSRFGELRFFRQVPFFGVTLVDEAADPDTASVSLDASLAGPSPEASHLVLLAGHLDPAPDERTLVELPLAEFLALTQGHETERRRETELLRVEVRQLKGEVERKDRSLRDISLRLQPLRSAIESRLRELDEERERLREARSSTAPEAEATILEPAPPAQIEVSALEAELALAHDNLRARLLEIEGLGQRLNVRDADVAALEAEVSGLKARLQTPPGGQDLAAARRVISRLEQTSGEQERRIHELEQELEEQARVRHTVGVDYRDAESRISYLKSRLEAAALERATELRDLTSRLGALTQALGQSDQDRELLKERILVLEGELHETRARADRAEGDVERFSRRAKGEFEASRQHARETDGLREEARRLAQENAQLERQVQDQGRIIDEFRGQAAGLSAQKTMLELAGAQATQEVEVLRRRVQELRNERDTLAATSELLLDERDEARKVARRALGVEQEAIELARAQETLTEALRRAIAEREEVLLGRDQLLQELAQLREERVGLRGELERAAARAQAAELRAEGARQRVQSLDQRLAELQTQAVTEADRTASSSREREALEEELQDVSLEARQAKLELADYAARVQSLEAAGQSAEQALGEALAEKARAEAELLSLSARLSVTDVERAKALAQAAVLKDRLQRLAEESERRLAASEEARRGIGLEQAAELTTRIAAMEEQLQAALRREAELKRALQEARAEAEEGSRRLSEKLKELERERLSAGEVIQFVEDSVGKLARKEEALLAFETWSALCARHIQTLEGALQKATEAARKNTSSPRAASAEPDPTLAMRWARLEQVAFEQGARAETLAGENERLAFALSTLEEAHRRLTLERRAQDDEILVSKAVLSALREREAELRERAQTLEHSYRDEAERAELASRRAGDLQAQLTELGLEAESLRVGYASAHDAVRAAERLHEDLEASLFSRVSELEERLYARSAELEAEQARQVAASSRLVEAQDLCARLERSLSERDEALAKLESAVSEGEEQIRAELVAAQETMRRLQDELARSAQEAQLQRADVESRLAVASRRASELESELSQLRPRLEEERTQLEAAEAARSALLAELESRGPPSAELEARLSLAEGQRQLAEARALDAESKLERLESRAQGAEARATELEAKAARAEERAERAERSTQSLETEARQSADTARIAKAEAEGMKLELERRLQEVREGKARLSDVETRAKEAELRFKGLEEELRRIEERAKKADLKAQDANQSLQESVRRVAELETQLADAQRRARSDVAVVQLTAAREELAQLKAKFERASSSPASGTDEQGLRERQAEVERLRAAAVQAARDVDEARAEVGRRLVDLSAKESALEQKERENAALNEHLEVLKAKLARQGDADLLQVQLREREQEFARLQAQKSAQEAEIERLRAMLQRAEEGRVQLELRAAELETQAAESQRKVDMLQRDVAEKSERLRRVTDLGE